jgi:hypothetical protein
MVVSQVHETKIVYEYYYWYYYWELKTKASFFYSTASRRTPHLGFETPILVQKYS